MTGGPLASSVSSLIPELLILSRLLLYLHGHPCYFLDQPDPFLSQNLCLCRSHSENTSPEICMVCFLLCLPPSLVRTSRPSCWTLQPCVTSSPSLCLSCTLAPLTVKPQHLINDYLLSQNYRFQMGKDVSPCHISII